MATPTRAPARCATGTGANALLAANTAVAVNVSTTIFVRKPMPKSATARLRRNSSVKRSAKSAESMPDSPRYVWTAGAKNSTAIGTARTLASSVA